MAGTFYKYAERDADSQVNWAEVGKGLSDMLAETNRVRQEKKDALDAAQRETMQYLTETPNGEDASARTAVLEYADQASNRMRIADQLLKSGQMSVKDYTIFRQNVIDGTNLLFNANKAYQEEYAVKMQRSRDGLSSLAEIDRMKDAEMFGNWSNTGFQIGANGVVMAGKMVEKEIDGKKVRTLDQTPGNLRNIDVINQLILGKIDKYDYEPKINSFVEGLGKEKKVIELTLGKLHSQGKKLTVEDITSRVDLDPETKQIMFKFIQAENDKVKEIAGTDFDKMRLLVDSAIIAPNGQPYEFTNDPEEAKKGSNFILKEYDPNTRGIEYKITEEQSKDAEDFIRNQIRAKYNYEEEADIIGQTSRNDEPEWKNKAKKGEEEAADAASMIGKLWYGNNNEVMSAIDYFKGKTDKDGNTIFKDFERDATGVTVVFANGESERISFTDANGNPRTQEDFIRSAGPLLAGQLDVNSALKKGSYKKGATFNKDSAGKSTTSTGNQRYKEYLEDNLDFSIIGKSEEEAEPLLKKYADEFGLVIEQTGAGDYILVKVPGEKAGTFLEEREFSFDESDPAKQKEIFDALIGYMASNAINTEKIPVKKGASSKVVKNPKGVGSKYNN